MIKFNVLNRGSGSVQFAAEIECAEDASLRIKMGLAVKWAYLRGADLSGAVLRGADLRDAVLRGADLSGAVLRGADLRGADLRDADLSGAVLRGADLRGAVLSGAVLSGAVLRDADLRGADIIFAGVDSRGYEFYLTAKDGSIVIRAGCRRWTSFKAARAHFGPGYDSNGNVPEIVAKLDLLETVARARGYLPTPTLAA